MARLGNLSKMLQRPRSRVALWVCISLLAAIRFFFHSIQYNPKATVNLEAEGVQLGYELYRHGQLANCYAIPTGPTAHVAPAFPALLAGLYHVFGDGANAACSIQVAESVALTAEALMLPLAARALGMDMMVGFIAAIMAIPGFTRIFIWENNYVGLLLVIAAVLGCKYLAAVRGGANGSPPKGRWPPTVLAAALGLVWGIVLLTGPSAAWVWVSWVVLGGIYSYRHAARTAWLPALVIPLVMLAPWTWRNYRVLHGFVFVRSNLGLMLQMSNNPCADFGYWSNWDCFVHLNPSLDVGEAQRVRDLGEVKYNREKLKTALAWINANRRAFLHLTLRRVIYFWFPIAKGSSRRNPVWPWVTCFTTLLSIPGLLALWRVNRQGALLLATFLLLYPPVYYVVHATWRYRLPIVWVTLLLAAATVYRVLLHGLDRMANDRKEAHDAPADERNNPCPAR
ncbi:MAG: hypothetical protein ACLQOO_17865 [Terriglobia bacterium]